MPEKMITPDQERTLSSALVSAIHNVNTGMAPNESLAKSACDHGLTPEFACRMVEAYNASKTVRHLQSTAGEKRAENFDLSDRDQVLKLMYTVDVPEKKAEGLEIPKGGNLPVSILMPGEGESPEDYALRADADRLTGAPGRAIITTGDYQDRTGDSAYLKKLIAMKGVQEHLAARAAKAEAYPESGMTYVGGNGFGDEIYQAADGKYHKLSHETDQLSPADADYADPKWIEQVRKMAGGGPRLRAARAKEQQVKSADMFHEGWHKIPVKERRKMGFTEDSEREQLKYEKQEGFGKHKAASGPALRENKVTKLASLNQVFKRLGEEIRMELANEKDQIMKAACAMETALRVPGHESFEEIEKRVTSTYGSLGKKAMDIVWSMADFERLGEKRASFPPDRLRVMGAGPAYDAARDLMKHLEKAAKLDTEMKDHAEKDKQIKKLVPESAGQQPGGTGATFVSDPGMPRRPATAPLVNEDGLTSSKAPAEKTSADDKDKGGLSLENPVKSLFSAQKPEVPSLFRPEHEAKIRGIRAKLLVNDMISNDPVLSAYPPENVLQAYNEASRVSPGLATEPTMMRTLVARSLQTGGRFEPNELKQILDAEKTNREIRVKGY